MQENLARQEDEDYGKVERDSFPRCLDELELFLVIKLLKWRPVEGTLRALSALNRDRFLLRPSPPDPARVLLDDCDKYLHFPVVL